MDVNKLITLLQPKNTIYSAIYPQLAVCMEAMQYMAVALSHSQFHILKQGPIF